jgi:hypothetical protein
MSGVVDANGQKWEHCYECRAFVAFPQSLGYVKPTSKFRPGYWHHVCVKCADKLIRSGAVRFSDIQPAPNWKRTLVERNRNDAPRT